MLLKSKPLSDEEYAALADFRHALRQFLEFSAKAAATENLTSQQHQAMLAIRGSVGGATSVGQLAERLCLCHNTAVELAQRLETAGHISRQHSAADRRQVVLALTPAGEAKLEILSQAHRRELQQIGPELRALFQNLSHNEPPIA
jgi:DNA-binding MarR family transcriptional regulator